MGFTVVGLALEVEGLEPARRYYEKYGVTFPALVDPNYATGFGVVPKTFFVDEHGVVRKLPGWENRLIPADQLRPVTDSIRNQWTDPDRRLAPAAIASLVAAHAKNPSDLAMAVDLASRYCDLGLDNEATSVLEQAIDKYDAHTVARTDPALSSRLSQAYLQLARASGHDTDLRVKYATMAFYLNPTVGFGKQIARIIAPEKFDGRPDGSFDNVFREGTLRRLREERREWIEAD